MIKMDNKKSTLDPLFNLGSIVFLFTAVILVIIKPDWVGSWMDAPAWFGGFMALYFVMAGISLRAYAKVSRVLEEFEKHEVMTYEDD